jgi:hypothetical protein
VFPDGIKVELTTSNSRKPDFYNKAMLELKRLEEEPVCHRMAAHLLMNTCRGLQDINEETLQFTKARMRRNHVESFAAALTLCDMEGVNWEIPEPCLPLSSTAMHQTIQDNRSTLVVASDQVQACLKTLSKDHTHWMTWLHRRDSALLFCRAASIDMDKDQMFESQKMLVKIMEDFAKDLDFELTALKENIGGQAREADKFFQGFMEHANQMKSRLQGTMDTVSKDIKVGEWRIIYLWTRLTCAECSIFNRIYKKQWSRHTTVYTVSIPDCSRRTCRNGCSARGKSGDLHK